MKQSVGSSRPFRMTAEVTGSQASDEAEERYSLSQTAAGLSFPLCNRTVNNSTQRPSGTGDGKLS